jgi:peptidoglycan/LPS O-acetylase OafA/YrhL
VARPSYFPALDGLRAVLLVAVSLRHFNHLWSAENLVERLYLVLPNLAISALDVFFAMSGFLITGILVDTVGAPGYFRMFYVRRMLRILPPYYAFLVIWFLLLPLVPGFGDMATRWSEQAWYWLHALNFRLVIVGQYLPEPRLYHLWSLAFEEQFYLLWPAVVAACSRPRLLRVCGAAFVGAFLFRLGVALTGTHYEVGFVLLPGRLDPLASGATLALIIRQPGGLDAVVTWSRRIAVLAGGAVLALIAVRRSFLPNDPVILTVGLTVSAVLAASIVGSVLRLERTSLAGRVLLHPAMIRVGGFTYAAYIWHWPVEVMAERMGFDPLAMHAAFGIRLVGQFVYWATLLVASVGMGALSWYAIEVHSLKLKRFFSYGEGTTRARTGGDV